MSQIRCIIGILKYYIKTVEGFDSHIYNLICFDSYKLCMEKHAFLIRLHKLHQTFFYCYLQAETNIQIPT
jgi:hypothetical protein